MFAGTHAYFTMEESRTCSVNYFCFGALLIFIGSILLCSLGFTVVLPFERTKYWPEVNCTVVSADVNQSLCACEEEGLAYPGCSEFSPCLQVIVIYSVTNGLDTRLFTTASTTDSNQIITTVDEIEHADNSPVYRNTDHVVVRSKSEHRRLDNQISVRTNLSGGIERKRVVLRTHPGQVEGETGDRKWWMTTTISPESGQKEESMDYYRQAMLFRSWGDVFYTHCSLQECGDESWNDKETRRFKAKWGDLGQSFPCYVNPSYPDTVILTKTSFWSMLHAVLWPSTCLFVGVTLWVGLCCGCWSLESENTASAYYGVL